MTASQRLDPKPLRIGLFGGTFDPVHNGHLSIAREALRQLQLDKVSFIPSGIPPSPRKCRPNASGGERLAMLRAALDGESRFEVSEYEMTRDGVSYTVDTVRHMASSNPAGTNLFFLLGDDCAEKLSQWVGIGEMRRLAQFVAVSRGGMPPPQSDWILRLNMPLNAVSSTEIRQRIAKGESVADMVPPAVCRLIEERRLYRTAISERVA